MSEQKSPLFQDLRFQSQDLFLSHFGPRATMLIAAVHLLNETVSYHNWQTGQTDFSGPARPKISTFSGLMAKFRTGLENFWPHFSWLWRTHRNPRGVWTTTRKQYDHTHNKSEAAENIGFCDSAVTFEQFAQRFACSSIANISNEYLCCSHPNDNNVT